MAQFPSTSGASGIWKLSEQRNAVMGSNWTSLISPLTADYLIVAGGAGGGGAIGAGQNGGGGGGAGNSSGGGSGIVIIKYVAAN